MVWSRFLLCILQKVNKNLWSPALILFFVHAYHATIALWAVLYEITTAVYCPSGLHYPEYSEPGSMPRLFSSGAVKCAISSMRFKGPQNPNTEQTGHIFVRKRQQPFTLSLDHFITVHLISQLRSGTATFAQTLKTTNKHMNWILKCQCGSHSITSAGNASMEFCQSFAIQCEMPDLAIGCQASFSSVSLTSWSKVHNSTFNKTNYMLNSNGIVSSYSTLLRIFSFNHIFTLVWSSQGVCVLYST